MRTYSGIIALLTFLLSVYTATVLAEPGGLDRAQKEVIKGTATGGEVLRDVEGEVPEEARPAIRRSQEESRTGGEEGLKAIERGRATTGAPSGRGKPSAGAGRGGPP